ncbi:MAG TPA: pyridoxine 5'-phosphate synthase, partial [Hyphomicrobium sp.]|nr:pyridoxine 5'-phosphate synthase [Hyphomicrobium sp.]
NLEMAATDEMLAIALRHLPNACCIVPERREERTTEGGLDVVGGGARLNRTVASLKDAGVRVSLFIEPDLGAVEASARMGADIVELHTGAYCERALEGNSAGVAREMARITDAARLAAAAGLEVHAGHGLTFNTVAAVARLPEIVELNIGHFLVGEAIFGGLGRAVERMRALMDAARREAASEDARARTA